MDKDIFNHTSTIRLDKFAALCKVASENNWCWKITCTTCGHSGFRVAFSKLAQGLDPREDSFWPYGFDDWEQLKDQDEYDDFKYDYNAKAPDIDIQKELAIIASEANIEHIDQTSRFPDWLGYIGLVIEHCQHPDAQKILSKSLLPQLATLIEHDPALHKKLEDKMTSNEPLVVWDLSGIELSLARNRNIW